MASNSGYTDQLPSNTSSVALGDDEFREVKNFMLNWWQEDHYGLDGSSGSAGVHKLGSARGFEMAATSELSNPTGDNSGKLAWVSANNSVYVADGSNSTWTLVASGINLGAANTWTALQTFSSGLSVSAPLTITPDTGNAIDGIVSGQTILKDELSLAANEENDVLMVNSSSILTFGDPIFVGFTDDLVAGARIIASAQVLSSGSIDIQFVNATALTRTLPSGTTIKYVAFSLV